MARVLYSRSIGETSSSCAEEGGGLEHAEKPLHGGVVWGVGPGRFERTGLSAERNGATTRISLVIASFFQL
jgi:hypothetical protein